MEIRHRVTYDAAPSAVFEMLTDPAFRERVCRALGTASHDVSVERAEDGATVRIDMLQSTRGVVPGFARKVVGDRSRVVQSERWHTGANGTAEAELELEIPGRPGHIRGRITLTGDESGAVEAFEGEAKINVPLLGGRIESVIEELFVEGMDTEQRVGVRWLAGER